MVNKYKNTVRFLVKFFAVYFILFGLYSYYLQQTQQKNPFQCAPITGTVAKQTVGMLNFLGYTTSYVQHDEELSIKVLVNNNYVARVIEGCNSISLIILFVAFILAFPGKLVTALIFSIIGGIFIYVINVFRIVFLTIMLHKYPNQQELLHSLVFPAIIYGTIFLLWVVWVNKFSTIKNE